MIWTRRIADEFWSGPVTPIMFSLLAETVAESMVRRRLEAAGLGALATEPVLLHHASHVYVNADLLKKVVGLLPAVLRSEGLLAILPPEARTGLPPGSLGAGSRAAAIAARLLLNERDWVPWRRAAAFDRACADLRAAFAGARRPGSSESAAALLDEVARVRGRLGDFLEVVSWGVVYSYVFYHLTTELARRWAGHLTDERAALTIGLPGVTSLAVHDEVRALGVLLAEDHELLETVRRQGSAAAWARITTNQGPVGDAFRSFLARHGHRLTARDLLYPTWRDAPEVVVDLAAQLAMGGARTAAPNPAERRRSATAAIERALGGGPASQLRRAAFRTSLAAAQRYAILRENMRYYADYAMARLRDLVLTLGSRLAAGRHLDSPLAICFLTLEEVGEAVRRGGDWRAFAAERQAAFERDRLDPPPPVLGAVPPAVAFSAVTLAGETASPGSVEGRARVVRGPGDFASVAAGDVLVAAYTDPTWTPMLELASGLVLEAGGQLSHGAIVARELGIPALVNVTGATRAIHDGDTVRVDGATGVVSIVARRPKP